MVNAFTADALRGMTADDLERTFAATFGFATCHNYSKPDKQALMDEYNRRELAWPGNRWTVLDYQTGLPVTDKEFATEWVANDWLNDNVETLDPPDVNAYEIDKIDGDE